MKMRSTILAICAVLLCLLLVPAKAEAATVASGTCGDALTWELDDAGTLTISGTGAMTDWYNGSAPWYANKDSIRAVIIEEGVTSVGNQAFSNCNSLTAVNIPASVTSIDSYAFYDCSSLTSVNIPASVTSIDALAFYGCSSLTSVNIPDGVTSIGEYAFSGCSSLTSVEIPASVTSIDGSAFSGCDRLTAIWVDENNTVYSNDEKGVLYNKDYTELIQAPGTLSGSYVIPASVTSIGYEAFSGCSGLTTVSIPESVTSIGGGAFMDCSSLTSVNILADITDIENYMFYRCSSLTSVSIPDGVTRIGLDAFGGCSALTSVDIPASVTGIVDGAFHGCSSLTSVDIPEGVKTIALYAFLDCSSLTSVNIPDSVTWIRSSAFEGCSSLTSVKIPASVTSIDSYAFDGCSALTDVNYYGTPAQKLGIVIGSDNGCLLDASWHYACGENLFWTLDSAGTLTISGTGAMYDWEANTIPWYADKDSIRTVIIEEGVTSIGYFAFYNCTNLTSVTIPESVTSIGYCTFIDCRALTSVKIPSGVTSIPGYAFQGCESLSSVNIPTGVTRIGEGAFIDCRALTSVEIPDGVTSIGWQAFEGCSNLISVKIPASMTRIEEFAFKGCEALTSVEIPAGVFIVAGNAFYGCTSLQGIWVDENNADYASDEKGVLYDKAKTRLIKAPGALSGSYVIPDGVTDIGYCAFYHCDGLTSVTIPASVTNIKSTPTMVGSVYEAFQQCANLTGIWVDEDNTAYFSDESGVLYNKDCTKLIQAPGALSGGYSIHSSCTRVEAYAFYGCAGLNTLNIPGTLTYINSFAFYGCSGLTEVYYSSSKENIEIDPLYGGNDPLTSAVWRYSCGENLFWALDDAGTLTISGSGAMQDWSAGAAPWYADSASIRTVVIDAGVTSVGTNAFEGCNALTTVRYSGSYAQKAAMTIGSGNKALFTATWEMGEACEHEYENGLCTICQNVTVGDVHYASIRDARYASGYLRLNRDLREDVCIDADTWIDLNGYTLTGNVTIADGATLYVFDSATADYTAQNRGKIVGTVTGKLARTLNTPSAYGHNYKYLALEESEGVWSFHRYYLAVKSVVLVPYANGGTETALNYRTVFRCNELLKDHVSVYGAQLVGDDTVVADYLADGFKLNAATNNQATTRLAGILKTSASLYENTVYAQKAPLVSACIVLDDGTVLTSTQVQMTLKEAVILADGAQELSEKQKLALGQMYAQFADVFYSWTDAPLDTIVQYAKEYCDYVRPEVIVLGCVCGAADGNHIGDCTSEIFKFNEAEGAELSASGRYYLNRPVTADVTLDAQADVTIDLAGKTFTGNITLSATSNLTVLDSVGGGKIEGMIIADAGTVNVYCGTVTVNGAAGTTVNVFGGNVSVNTAGALVVGHAPVVNATLTGDAVITVHSKGLTVADVGGASIKVTKALTDSKAVIATGVTAEQAACFASADAAYYVNSEVDGLNLRPAGEVWHCICGDYTAAANLQITDPNYCANNGHKSVKWTAWTATNDLPVTTGYWYLTNTVTIAKVVEIGANNAANQDVVLDLNGHTVTNQTNTDYRIYRFDYDSDVSLGNHYSLTITDTSAGKTGNITPVAKTTANNGMIIWANKANATINLYGGKLDASKLTLQAAASDHRNGAAINTVGTLNMYGGSILGAKGASNGNYRANGGAIHLGGSAVMNMTGGSVTGGASGLNMGGAVNMVSTAQLHMSGNAIINGGSSTTGAGIRTSDNCVITMSGEAQIIGGSATNGGGVFLEGGSSLTMSGNAKISGSKAAGGGTYGKGGGVIMNGATCALTMSGNATITGCTSASSNGAGVHVANGTLTVSGNAKITGNTNASGTSNVHLDSGETIIIGAAGLGEEAEIGITLANGTGTFATGTAPAEGVFTSDNNAYVVNGLTLASG